ncbi:MAG TPA: SDR family oxidoreductase [Chitinophagaceae bacterium]|nr:SDR family oxidoreductase [Chitinophagaceae bacterium]
MSYALVTGASKGIGKAIARCLAGRGYGLLLVARSEELLRENAEKWKNEYSVDVRYLSMDLSAPDSPQRVFEWVNESGVPLNILINNAGYGLWGNFHTLSLERQMNMLQINITTLVNLTHKMIPLLQKNTPAYILNVGSMAGLQAMPSVNAYSASKAFVNSFSRGLYHELKPSGIQVTVLVPGSVDTNFVEVSGMQHMEEKARRASMSAEQVAGIAVKALFNKKIAVIPGGSNRLMAFGIKHLPKFWVEKMAASLYRKREKTGSLPVKK